MKPQALSTIKPKVKTKLKTNVYRYTGDDIPAYHLFSLEVAEILYCPECGGRFTTCDPKKNLEPSIKHEINSDFNSTSYEAICFKCGKEWKFDLFIGWMENAFDIEFTVEQTADLNGSTNNATCIPRISKG